MIIYIGNKLLKHGLTPTSVDTLGEKLKDMFPVKTISAKKNKVFRFFDIIKEIIKHRNEAQLILIDTYSTWNFYYAVVSAFLALRFNIKYIPILHGGSLPQKLENNPQLSRFLFSNSLTNISPSTYLYEAFRKQGFKVEHIPNSIDIGSYPFKMREVIRPRLLFVRSFHKIYNPEMAVKVLYEIQKKYKDASLCMVGPDKDGSLEEVKKLAEDLKISDKIKFTGKLPKSEWISLSSDYDIFINTTHFDNHPVSVIEGMALGLPVVSTNVGGIPYLIENGTDGLLVPQNDVKKFVEALDQLIDNPELSKKIILAARKKAESYSWAEVKMKWSDIINSSLQAQTA
jgi:glycosyltransferase involved in cell wall biosynthesis